MLSGDLTAEKTTEKKTSADLGLGENDTQPTIGAGGSRVWLYPREVKGRKTTRRTWVAWALLLIYLGVPWLQWNGAPLLQLDVFQFRLSVLGHSYYPQDIKLFLPAFLSFIVVVFLVTAKYGRVWCGWACPQTVFLQFVFAPIEKLIEGRASVRRARDTAGFSFDKAWRKVAKHILFFGVAFLIANTALAYLWGRDNMLLALGQSPAQNPEGFGFVLVFTLVFYWIFSYFKEQACVLICPYAKFQSVLLDDRSLIVGYDAQRGEARGKGVKGNREGLGDCVDCHQCVQVCPTGIDIRKGQQLECIACTRCMDACDSTMTAWKKPTGLIRYDSLAGLERRPVPGVRKRLITYSIIAILLAGISVFLIASRPEVAIDVVRRGSNPYLHVGTDSILNTFTVHVRNKGLQRRTFTLRFAEPFQGRHNWEGRTFNVGAGQLETIPLDIISLRNEFDFGKRNLQLELQADGVEEDFSTTLIGPFGKAPSPIQPKATP